MGTLTQIGGYKYRIYPNYEQRVALSQLFGCVRYVYNWGLSRRIEHYRETGESINSYDLSKELTQHKKSLDKKWLNDVLRMPLRVSLFNLDKAYNNFFQKRAKRPRFKKKQNKQSATITYQYFAIRDKKLSINKIPGLLKLRWSRYWSSDADVKSITVSKDVSERFFVSFLVSERVAQLRPIENKIGIDMGLTHFLTTSEGEKVDNPKYFVKQLQKYRRLCRAFSRKKNGSRNKEKMRIKKARLSTKITDRRRDFQHKLSSRLICENQAIGLESLSVENMLKNRHLSKHIADASWSTFLTMLSYKGNWYGRDIATPEEEFFPSSKMCSTCGFVLDALPLSVREWTCPVCSTCHDRDVNAAINIRNHTVGETEIYACGDSVRPQRRSTRQESVKQELSLRDSP